MHLQKRSEFCLKIMVFVTGCQLNLAPTANVPAADSTQTALASQEPTVAATITPTPIPLALTVNNAGVPLVEYQASLSS